MALSDNPLGMNGFALVEFAARESDRLDALFERFGFSAIGVDPTHKATLYGQGDIRLLLNCDPRGRNAAFRAAHGPGVSAMGFWVRDGVHALGEVVKRGAKAVEAERWCALPAIECIGGGWLYLVDEAGYGALTKAFAPARAVRRVEIGLVAIDHVAHNLQRGAIEGWTAFFEHVLGFKPIRYFHIAGKETGFRLRALASPCGKIRIPLNESADARSQIEDFLVAFKGEGVQHIGFATADIHQSVEALTARGVEFQTTADSYYQALPARVSGHEEDLARLRANGVLLDGGAEEGLLMQIFTRNMIGPLFFELIQRKGNDGFGEGNVTALFESIEAEQMRRGGLQGA